MPHSPRPRRGCRMTERRPHWDDELIFAVMSAAGDGGHLFIDDIHAVIAAVEDWEKETFNAATEVLVERIQKAEAQVRAVRELCQSARVSISKGCLCHGDECSGTCGRGKPLAWNLNPDDILRILDGDA